METSDTNKNPDPSKMPEITQIPSDPKSKSSKRGNLLGTAPIVLSGQESEHVIADFEMGKQIGEGGYGKVYEVTEIKSGKKYAMKQISKRFIKNNHFGSQLKNEVEIMYKLHHPHIIQLETHFEDDKYVYLIIELADKGALNSVIRKSGRFSEEVAKKCLRETVKALQYLHSQNPAIIHRDIKPENILLDKDGVTKLADFGWSNVIIDEKRQTACGTPDYMAPEMIDNQGHDTRMDYWCLGVLLYECMTGKKPFSPTEQDIKDAKEKGINLENVIINKITNVQYTFPPDFPKGAQDVIERLLKKDPADRLTGKDLLEHPWVKE
jgi:aurora kinase B/aurora kinase A